jgi:[ribosomal protein S18]-alanine N-acetyltransferase
MIYQVRRMRPEDVGAVVALAAGLPTAPHWPRETYLAVLKPGMIPVRIALVAVMAGGKLLGFAVASVIPQEAELESIAVSADWQRLGIGRRLFEVLLRELADAGVREVFLEVRASNLSALATYGVLGFVETGRRPGYYTHPVEDAVLMRRAIG